MKRVFALFLLALVCAGCQQSGHRLELRPAGFEPGEDTQAITMPGTDVRIYVSQDVLLTETDFKAGHITRDASGRRAVQLTLNAEAADRFYTYTRDNLQKPVAIYMDGKFLSAPLVMAPLRDQLLISGGKKNGMTESQAKRIIRAVEQAAKE